MDQQRVTDLYKALGEPAIYLDIATVGGTAKRLGIDYREQGFQKLGEFFRAFPEHFSWLYDDTVTPPRFMVRFNMAGPFDPALQPPPQPPRVYGSQGQAYHTGGQPTPETQSGTERIPYIQRNTWQPRPPDSGPTAAPYRAARTNREYTSQNEAAGYNPEQTGQYTARQPAYQAPQPVPVPPDRYEARQQAPRPETEIQNSPRPAYYQGRQNTYQGRQAPYQGQNPEYRPDGGNPNYPAPQHQQPPYYQEGGQQQQQQPRAFHQGYPRHGQGYPNQNPDYYRPELAPAYNPAHERPPYQGHFQPAYQQAGATYATHYDPNTGLQLPDNRVPARGNYAKPGPVSEQFLPDYPPLSFAGKTLFTWAFWPDFNEAFNNLAELCLPEAWDFSDGETHLRILKNYMNYTLYKHTRDGTVIVSDRFAAFNTGLVNKDFNFIYCLFYKNPGTKTRFSYKFADFCIAGEGQYGKELTREFNPLPPRINYFRGVSENPYSQQFTAPIVDIDHIVLERTARLPITLLTEFYPLPDYSLLPSLSPEDRKTFFAGIAQEMRHDQGVLNKIKSRLEFAIAVSVKKAAWDYKTAVPMYYPPFNIMSYLLPLCIMNSEVPDCALVVEKTKSGAWQGHTILPLDMAYLNARLISRPDNGWLVLHEIRSAALTESFE